MTRDAIILLIHEIQLSYRQYRSADPVSNEGRKHASLLLLASGHSWHFLEVHKLVLSRLES